LRRELSLSNLPAAGPAHQRSPLLSCRRFARGSLLEELNRLLELYVLYRLRWSRLDLWLGRLGRLGIVRCLIVLVVGNDNIGVDRSFDLHRRLDTLVHERLAGCGCILGNRNQQGSAIGEGEQLLIRTHVKSPFSYDVASLFLTHCRSYDLTR